MVYKPSKLDIGPIARKQKETKPRREIKREIFEHEIRLKPRNVYYKKPIARKSKSETNDRPKFRGSSLASFAAGALALLVFVQSTVYLSSARDASGEILGAATSAYENLKSAGSNLEQQNFDQAAQLFQSAQNNLLQAQERLAEYKALTYLTPQAKTANNLLQGAYLLSNAGHSLTEALKLFDELKVSSLGIETESFAEKLAKNHQLLSVSLSLLNEAQKYFEDTGKVPDEYLGNINEAKAQIDQLRGILQSLIGLEDLYLAFIGTQPKTYLLAFQNYDEARGTGGFIGTYGVLKVDSGEIKKLKIESIYEFDGSLTENIAAPGPFQPDIKKWGLRDANWFLDFPSSAAKLLYFFEKGGETADGVITFTPKIFEQLLTLVGPIYMQPYDMVLTPANFQSVVQEQTSVQYDKQLNQPKKFLADFAPILLNRLGDLKKESWFTFFQIIQDNLNARQIMLYSKEQSVQSKIELLGFAGEILNVDHDYLMVANTNMGGTKTDLDMVTKVNLRTKILSDGTAVNYLQIKKTNTSNEPNRNYMRVLVPFGSELISSDGIVESNHNPSSAEGLKQDPDLASWDKGELRGNKVFVRTEAGKQEFAAWVITAPHATSEVNLTYILPLKFKTSILKNSTTYSMLLQKQAGSIPFEFTHELDTAGLTPQWLTKNVRSNSSGLTYISNSNLDDYWAAVLNHE